MTLSYVEPAISVAMTEFIAAERMRFEGDDNNRVAFSLAQVARYLRFLGHVHARYLDIAEIVGARFEGISKQMRSGQNMTSAELEGAMDGWKYDVLLHLEIETFFCFRTSCSER